MRRYHLAFCVLLLLPAYGQANTLDDAMEWIAENSRFEYVDDPPTVIGLDPVTWENKGWQNNVAIYDEGTIYVPSWKPTSDSTWIHELVHHYQWLNGELTPETCPGSKEPEAYAIEKAWGRAHDVAVSIPSRFTIMQMKAGCMLPQEW